MASSFYAEFFSWSLAALLSLPFFISILIHREKIKLPSAAILPMILLIGLHATALIFSHTIFAKQIIKDLIIASFLIYIYSLAGREMLSGFFSILIPLALITALFGLMKAALLDRGYLIDFIFQNCSPYPAGSALCINYNNLGLIWLVAALGCMRKRWWVLIPVLLAAGALVSSRRFLILMAFLPFIYFSIEGKLSIIKSLFIIAFSVTIIQSTSNPASFERFRFGDEPFQIINTEKIKISSFTVANPKLNNAAKPPSINRSTPEAILGTMADSTLGTGSRLDLWKVGLSMLSYFPHGWNYHQIFSCLFASCTGYSYPHMSIMTEWIIGGVIFGFIALLSYTWPFYIIFLKKNNMATSLFLISTPYSLISGDTVFSLPICLSCMLVALSAASRHGNFARNEFQLPNQNNNRV